jgi:hypothetical protein
MMRVFRLTCLAVTNLTLIHAASQVAAQEAIVSGVNVTASELAGGTLHQEQRVGPYNQPEWTTQRSFSTSRVYVRPAGTAEFVQYWTPEFKGGEVEHGFREELEIGLPYRFQLDLYQNWGIEDGDARYRGSSVELRYAFADWGKIPFNPTIYGEWNFKDAAPDVGELKLLLGETFAHRWNWAINFTYEHEMGGEREREFQISSALTYAVLDEKLNVGLEALWERKTSAESRSDPEYELLVGPSINVRPTRHTFVTAAPLFGATDDSPDVEIFLVAGFHFSFGGRAGAKDEGPRAPASMFGR